MASRTDTALDQLNHIIDTTISSVKTFEPFDWYTTLKSLYTALDHQLQDGLMGQQEFDRTRFIVRKLWDLKLQIHMIEKEGMQLSDVIGHVITLMLHLYSEGIITRSLFVYVCMSRLITKGIIRSFRIRQRRIASAVKPANGTASNCDGLLFNAQRYIHMNDAYFFPSTIRFPY